MLIYEIHNKLYSVKHNLAYVVYHSIKIALSVVILRQRPLVELQYVFWGGLRLRKIQ